jgi:hypothetical protein
MQTAESRLVGQIHRQAIETSIPDIAATLQDMLSRRLVAYVAGVKDAKTVSRWANGEVTAVRDDSEKRLRVAFEIAQLLLQFDSPRVVKAWFIGLNPQLGDVSPADTIREGKLKEAMVAARAFVTGG